MFLRKKRKELKKIMLENYYNLTYEIKLIDEDGNEDSLSNDDIAMVTLTEEETGYTVIVSHPETADTILLIPGTYEVSGTLVSESSFDIEIPADSFTKCTSVPMLALNGLFGTEDDTSCIDVDVDEYDTDSGLSGGVELTWTVDRDDLNVADHVTFFVTSPGVPEDMDDIEEIMTYLDMRLGMSEPELE